MANTKYVLKNGDTIEASFRLLDVKSTEAITSRITSWQYGEPGLDEEFVCESWVKWDGCGHFNFYGEDRVDSYYHLCGDDSLYMHFILVAFTRKCWYLVNEANGLPSNPLDENIENILKGFTIERTDWTSDDEYTVRQLKNHL